MGESNKTKPYTVDLNIQISEPQQNEETKLSIVDMIGVCMCVYVCIYNYIFDTLASTSICICGRACGLLEWPFDLVWSDWISAA